MGSVSDSPKCVSVNRLLNADGRQKSGTSNGPWSLSMPLVVVGCSCRCRNSALLTELTRLPTRPASKHSIEHSHLFGFITLLNHHHQGMHTTVRQICQSKHITFENHPSTFGVYKHSCRNPYSISNLRSFLDNFTPIYQARSSAPIQQPN
jgi:hypothetical protein